MLATNHHEIDDIIEYWRTRSTTTNLKLITDHNGEDISHLKIYYDEKTEQFQKRIRCKTCDVVLANCMCYNNLDDAVAGNTQSYCNRHYIEEVWYDEELYNLIDSLFDVGLCKYVSLIWSISNGDFAITEESTGLIDEGLWCKCHKMVADLTDEQISKLMSEIDIDCDEVDGWICEV